jgi:D-3-phosphoglycerate dehydrogenase
LYDALKSGRIGAAALDTFNKEPYPGPLINLENVVLTPHIGSYAQEARILMERQAAENLLKGLGVKK